jgi:hypothetical protein
MRAELTGPSFAPFATSMHSTATEHDFNIMQNISQQNQLSPGLEWKTKVIAMLPSIMCLGGLLQGIQTVE